MKNMTSLWDIIGERDAADFSSLPVESVYDVGRRYNVFVYGTMKKGFRNASRLDGAVFLGDATTMDIYRVATRSCRGGYEAPVAIPDGDQRVGGELYTINGSMLHHLDLAEGHPYVYRRVYTAVRNTTTNKFMTAFIYEMPVNHARAADLTQVGIEITNEVANFTCRV